MIGRTIGDLAPGDRAELSRRVERHHVADFVQAVGDFNPIHSDPRFAAATSFREPIAPGVFTAGLVSAVIGTQLPGPGAIYLSQTLKFHRPVKLGETITARVEVAEVLRERNRARLETVCVNESGETVLSGEAWVMPSRAPVRYHEDRGAPALLALHPMAWMASAVALWGRLGATLLCGPTSKGRR
jgi:acyl dehydratase